LTAVKVSDPSHGSVTLNSNGFFSYTPNAGFTGTDSFTYKANDGRLDSPHGTVTIRVSDGFVGHWKCDETSGTTASDSAGNDNPGALVAGPKFVNDNKRGRVLSLTSSNDRVEVAPAVDLGPAWTIASWFRGLAAGTWRTLTRGQGGDHQIIVASSGELGSYDNVGGTRFRGSGFNMNSLSGDWHHVAAVGHGGETVFYVDGLVPSARVLGKFAPTYAAQIP